MPWRTKSYLALIILTTVSGSSQAQTIYNDGGTHTVNGSSGAIEVLNGSTLNINSPASVTGDQLDYSPVSAIYGDSTSTMNLSGGQVNSPSTLDTGFSSGIATFGNFSATGGTVQGITSGLFLGSPVGATSSQQIGGGTFIGAGIPADGIPGTGAIIDRLLNSISITGGSFQGNAGGNGLQLELDIASGSITSGSFLGQGGGSSLLYVGNSSSSLDISGGVFSSSMTVDLSDPSAALNFFGQGFQLTEAVPGLYIFTGTLTDGNSLDVTLFIGSFTTEIQAVDGQEEFSFFGVAPAAVPEPSSIVTLATGLAGLAVVGVSGRRRLGRTTRS